MLNSGVPVVKALEALTNSGEEELQTFGRSVYRYVTTGHYLSQSIGRASDTFSKAQLASMATGEMTGSLPLILNRLSTQMEREQNLRKQLLSSLTYPLGILVLTGLMAVFMMNFMLPQLMSAAGGMLKNPPLATRFLLSLSDYGALTTTVLLVALCCLPWFFSSVPQAQAFRTWALFESPVLGKIGNKTEIANLSRQMALLLYSGQTVNRALVALHSRNPKLNRAIEHVLKYVTNGMTLSEAFEEVGGFGRDFTALLQVGEETGRLSLALEKQADFLEMNTQRDLQDLVKLVEPLTMMVLGIVVGVVILGSFLPIYQVVSQTL